MVFPCLPSTSVPPGWQGTMHCFIVRPPMGGVAHTAIVHVTSKCRVAAERQILGKCRGIQASTMV